MKKIIILITVCFVCSCKTSQVNYTDWNKLIEGSWKLTAKYQVNYPRIIFTEKGAVFNSLADTIYGFSCTIKKNNLILFDGVKSKTSNKILKLTEDSLVFETLLENPTPQRYVREKTNN